MLHAAQLRHRGLQTDIRTELNWTQLNWVTYCAYVCLFIVEMALYKAKKAGQTLAAQKKLEEVSTL